MVSAAMANGRPHPISSPSAPTPLAVMPDAVEENGRLYHYFHKGNYMFPCDEEEKDRMDIYHKLFSVARKGAIHSAQLTPAYDTTRILDLGTGTGIWAIEMADKYKAAEVVGLDLSPIQPRGHPQNLSFYVRDIESTWEGLGVDRWDLIHMRMLNGSLTDWGKTYAEIFRHLKPQIGWMEQIEIDYEPRCDDNTIPQFADIKTWYRALDDATTIHFRPIRYNRDTRETLENQGFVDVHEEIIKLPLNSSWDPNPHHKDIGRWYNLGLTQGLEALTLAPLRRKSNWTREGVDDLISNVKKEVCSRKIHVYHELHIWTARRP